MSASIFDNKHTIPGFSDLEEVLGSSGIWFKAITELIEKEAGKLLYEWKYYGQKSGWVLKLLSGKRNILFVIPCKGYFKISLTFGEKATGVILTMDLPESVLAALKAARIYAEGRTIQVEVCSYELCQAVISLIQVKIRY